MPDTPPEPSGAPEKVVELWSAIVPGDLGLKAGYYPEGRGESVSFKPLLGWITVTARGVDSGNVRNQFIGVVMGPLSVPVPATIVPGYLGVFPNSMAPHEAWDFSARWRPAGTDASGPPPPADSGSGESATQNTVQRQHLRLVPTPESP